MEDSEGQKAKTRGSYKATAIQIYVCSIDAGKVESYQLGDRMAGIIWHGHVGIRPTIWVEPKPEWWLKIQSNHDSYSWNWANFSVEYCEQHDLI